mgnify:CR=1 FL=1
MPRKKIMRQEEARTYVESIIIVMLFLMTVLSLIITGFGFLMPSGMLDRLLTNLLLIFIVAEIAVVILLLYRIYQAVSGAKR